PDNAGAHAVGASDAVRFHDEDRSQCIGEPARSDTLNAHRRSAAAGGRGTVRRSRGPVRGDASPAWSLGDNVLSSRARARCHGQHVGGGNLLPQGAVSRSGASRGTGAPDAAARPSGSTARCAGAEEPDAAARWVGGGWWLVGGTFVSQD